MGIDVKFSFSSSSTSCSPSGSRLCMSHHPVSSSFISLDVHYPRLYDRPFSFKLPVKYLSLVS